MGNPAVINETKALLLKRHELQDLSIRQLERILLVAAESPMTKPDLTKARITYRFMPGRGGPGPQ